MSADRERLAAVLGDHRTTATSAGHLRCSCDGEWRLPVPHRAHLADALLPVVQALVAEGAAAELRAAADWLNGDGDGPAAPEWPETLPRTDVAAMLHGRADEFAELGCPDCESPFHGRPCPRADALDPT